MRKFRDDLVFAAWIGRADVDAADAWRRYETMWENLKEPMFTHPAMQPLPIERAGMHLFRAWHRSDSADALSWLRNHTSPVPLGLALRVLMEEARDAEARQKYFTEFCQRHPAGYLDLGSICAGVAMHDPDQAMEFAHWGRSEEEPLTSESPERIAYSMIRYWSMSQPDQALDFIVRPEFEDWQLSWITEYSYAIPKRRPEMLIRALEREELAWMRDRILMEIYFMQVMGAGTNWPLVDEELSLPPEERVRVLREAIDEAELPEDLKTRLRAGMVGD